MIRRKEIYDSLHPETKPTIDDGDGRRTQTRRQIGDDTVPTASPRTQPRKPASPSASIQRASKRGKEIGARRLLSSPRRRLPNGSPPDRHRCFC